MSDSPTTQRYAQIIEYIFLQGYNDGDEAVPFEREDIQRAAETLNIQLPKNFGDVIYSVRYRTNLPQSVQERAPTGKEWVILPNGRARYRFVATAFANIIPGQGLVETKVPDSTPGVIAKYAFSDEQALLAKLRYNRLIDIFTGVTCYSLQNHLRTTVTDMGQVETDEIYIGVDRRGIHYVFPVQAKGGNDRLSIVQILQDFALCREKFPSLVCRPIAAQFMQGNLIALFELEQDAEGIKKASEKHYKLVPHRDVSEADLITYQQRLTD